MPRALGVNAAAPDKRTRSGETRIARSR